MKRAQFPLDNPIRFIQNRTPDSHKGDYGRAFCVVGSYSMAGAAIIASRACLRSGIGICDVCLPDSIYPIVASAVPEAVYTIRNDDNQLIFERMEKATAILIGCGLGLSAESEDLLNTILLNAKCPLVIDADGINLLKKHIDLLERYQNEVIITPHLAEMSRLVDIPIDDIKRNKTQIASDFAKKHGVTVVLKDHHTVVATPDCSIYQNTTGNAGMSTGGSGDMLAGMITAFVAQGYNANDSAKAAVFLHGAAGDLAAEKFGMISMLPTDMIELLPETYSIYLD